MKKIILAFITLHLSALMLLADNLQIAAGAGYKKPVMKVLEAYNQNHPKIDAIFGNMKQVSIQAQQMNLALIIGDQNFLEKKSGLDFQGFQTVGTGKAVIAYPTNGKLTKVEDLLDKKVQKIAIPAPEKAIYGTAAKQFLDNSGFYPKIKDKVMVVATVPQVSSYVITGDVDAGIINLTDALGNKGNIGGYVEIPQKYYSPIKIVAGILPSCKPSKECQNFLEFLTTDTAKNIFKEYGL